MNNEKAEKITRYIFNELREVRKKCHFTQEEVAFALNITASYLSRIENGKFSNTPMSLFIQLCDLYSIDFDKIISRAYEKAYIDTKYK